MADTTAGGPTSASETRDFERRNTDPTIPFDGALPENIAGPISNVQLEVAAEKRAAAHRRGLDEGSDRLRPEHAKQEAKTGDAITDSDVLANPAAGLNVGEDAGAGERAKVSADADKAPADEGKAPPDEGKSTADEGKSTPPQGRSSTPRGKQTA
jgi:hypothetical protein